ncbi:MAG: hemin-degrading factor, partial [Actinomycetia bacterium]|nr:hemin-degrading factor [Actinomycetes bacterium]
PLAQAAAQLGVTEAELAAAMGDPNSGPPDFEAAAATLGISVDDLMDAIGTPPDAKTP